MKILLTVAVLVFIPYISLVAKAEPNSVPIASKNWTPSHNIGQAAKDSARKCVIYVDQVQDEMWGPISPVNGQRPYKAVRRRTLYSPNIVANASHAHLLIQQTQKAPVNSRPWIDDLGQINHFVNTSNSSMPNWAIIKGEQQGVGTGWKLNMSPATTPLVEFIDKNCP